MAGDVVAEAWREDGPRVRIGDDSTTCSRVVVGGALSRRSDGIRRRKDGWRAGIPEVVFVVVVVGVRGRRLQLIKPRKLDLVQAADDHRADEYRLVART